MNAHEKALRKRSNAALARLEKLDLSAAELSYIEAAVEHEAHDDAKGVLFALTDEGDRHLNVARERLKETIRFRTGVRRLYEIANDVTTAKRKA